MKARMLYARETKKGRKKTSTFKSANIFFCSKCLIVSKSREDADGCCGNRKCTVCGEPTDKQYVGAECDACMMKRSRERDAERFAKAKKHTVAECPADVPLYDDDEHFYQDIDTAMEDLEEYVRDSSEVKLWFCDKRTPKLDVERIFESLGEDLCLQEGLEIDDVCEETKELEAAIDAWNAKQKPSVYMERNDAYVVITADDYPAEDEEAA